MGDNISWTIPPNHSLSSLGLYQVRNFANSGLGMSPAYQSALASTANQAYIYQYLNRPIPDALNVLPERAIDRLRLEIKKWHGDALRAE